MKKLFLLFVLCVAPMAFAQHADVQPLLSKDLSGIPGKEGLMVKVTFPQDTATACIGMMPMYLFMSLRTLSSCSSRESRP